ncbi:undecaprenyl-diphosphatase [Tahibacter aquaticus]|uniref:Undecaprenyl-diphosphatase n=1 Tax=Tahibacter aquaticus TaxID=520092 RepID=A0A4R6Z269_9GAMM|nr:undecaprenyl-diphosphatase [Tahibacter aquaticus]
MNGMQRIALVLACLSIVPVASAGGGPFGIDHRLNYDNSGIWRRSVQTGLQIGVGAAVLGGAVWEGGESRLGRTLWQSVDAMALSGATTQVMKFTFSRERPSRTDDPNAFFKGRGNQSFPSGEVAQMAAAVMPFVLEYGDEHPAVYALGVLPAYDMVARMKVRGHWQSDVLAGLAVGAAFGWYAHGREQPLVLNALPDGFMVGWSKHF